jgi:glycosyltransferase involved in cell wall biosynthesis
MTRNLKITHFQRKPFPGHVSIERLFSDIRNAMPDHMECSTHVCPFFSKGVLPRIRNMLDARRHQSQINHITGDVHYLALALDKRRTLLTIADCASLDRLRGLRRAVLKLFWFTLPVWRARLVMVISESTRQELLRHTACDPEKIRVVHCCISDDFIPASKPFNAEEPEILHLGTAANKNLERLAEALVNLPVRLNIIGQLTAAQVELLKRRNIRYSNTPRATDAEVLKAFQGCDALAFVSTYEGFGLPIVEANAVGRPVVTSNLLSMPEVAGNAACLVDPFDVAAIRAGILRIWKDEAYRENLIQAGFENVKRFTPRAIAEQYAAIYRELAVQE